MPDNLRQNHLEEKEKYKTLSAGQKFSLIIHTINAFNLGLIFEALAANLLSPSLTTLALGAKAGIFLPIGLIPAILCAVDRYKQKKKSLEEENNKIIETLIEIEILCQRRDQLFRRLQAWQLTRKLPTPPQQWTIDNLELVRDEQDALNKKIEAEINIAAGFCERSGIPIDTRYRSIISNPSRNIRPVFEKTSLPEKPSYSMRETARNFLAGFGSGFGFITGALGIAAIFFAVLAPWIIGVVGIGFGIMLGVTTVLANKAEQKRQRYREQLDQEKYKLTKEISNIAALSKMQSNIESTIGIGRSIVAKAVRHQANLPLEFYTAPSATTKTMIKAQNQQRGTVLQRFLDSTTTSERLANSIHLKPSVFLSASNTTQLSLTTERRGQTITKQKPGSEQAEKPTPPPRLLLDAYAIESGTYSKSSAPSSPEKTQRQKVLQCFLDSHAPRIKTKLFSHPPNGPKPQRSDKKNQSSTSCDNLTSSPITYRQR
ncbi:MAG: hypothetical protein K0S08_144 [Gammaproteobacteria bacterium]|jgi:hypothetical protein|nr:hypothetical protein [Gammaproteobacteria bacterium]